MDLPADIPLLRLAFAAAATLVVTLFVRWLLLRSIPPLLARHSPLWAGILEKRRVLQFLYLTVPGLMAALLIQFSTGVSDPLSALLYRGALVYSFVMLAAAIASALYAYGDYYEQHFDFAREVPIKTLIQVAVVILAILTGVLVLAVILGVPLLALAGVLAAVGAVAYYLFREPLLGFTASLQLSTNRMLGIGDWIEMKQFGVDGQVEEINVTSTKVRNWDNAIVNVPTYALIQNPFQNWRDMQNRQARRIQRALVLDQLSIRFASEALVQQKKAEIAELYEELPRGAQQNAGFQGVRPSDLRQKHALTNLELFMAYATCIIAAHPSTRVEETMYVRQQAPSAEGLPVELYFFTRAADFVPYHAVQREIFSHLLAVLPQFDLRPYQIVQSSHPA